MTAAVPYVYVATVDSVHDGDSLTATFTLARARGHDADFGFHIYRHGGHLTFTAHVRLLGIDAPELPSAAGVAARDFLRSLLPVGTQCTIATHLDRGDKYGRILGTVSLRGQQTSVNQQMLDAGHAVPYDGGHR